MPLLQPISEVSEIGEDFTNDDRYLELEIEIEQSFNDVSQKEPDWEFIIKLSENILQQYSKDFKVMSYWLYAQWKFNGFNTFLKCFNTFALFLLKYNKTLYPHKEKRKIKILEWMDKVFEKPISMTLKQLSKEQLELLNETFTIIQEAIPLSIEEEIIFLKPVYKQSRELLDAIEKKEQMAAEEKKIFKIKQKERSEEDKRLQKEREEQQRQNKEVISKFIKQGSTSKTIQNDTKKTIQASQKDIKEYKDKLLELTNNFLDSGPGEYLPIGVLFFYGTAHLEEIFADSKIKTDKLLPSEDVIKAIKDSLEGDILLTHLRALEELIEQMPSWLEGYFLVAKMLHRLNAKQSAKQIEEDLFRYIDMQDACMKFSTSAGQKLVPLHLETWVKQKVLTLRGESDHSIKYKKAFQDAISLTQREGRNNALEFLNKHYGDATSGEERFNWRLMMADFVLQLGDKRLALTLLLELEDQINTYKLDVWQPHLAVKTYEFLLRPVMIQEMGEDNKERIYKKICILDLQKVIKS